MGAITAQKLTKRTKAKLMKMGIYTHAGGFGYDPIMAMGSRTAVMAIWYESEEPTAEELVLLKEIYQGRVTKWYPDVDKNFLAMSANTTTLKKENGVWTYRRMTWREGPTWSQKSGTLQEIRVEGRF
ncbi:MAG: hypothetical protein Q8P76_01935 [bacterium]|nr:hypothetical protein [bacterium]